MLWSSPSVDRAGVFHALKHRFLSSFQGHDQPSFFPFLFCLSTLEQLAHLADRRLSWVPALLDAEKQTRLAGGLGAPYHNPVGEKVLAAA